MLTVAFVVGQELFHHVFEPQDGFSVGDLVAHGQDFGVAKCGGQLLQGKKKTSLSSRKSTRILHQVINEKMSFSTEPKYTVLNKESSASLPW